MKNTMTKEDKISLALSLIEQTRKDAEDIRSVKPKIAERIIANTAILEGLVTGDYSKLPVTDDIASGE